MLEWPLILLGGLLGSSHCVGMCGGFAISIGGNSIGIAENLRRQLVYTLGRVFTYAFLGAVAGYAGLRATGWTATLFNAQSLLSIAAGTVLLLLGLRSSGILPRRRVRVSTESFCPARSIFAAFLTSPGLTNQFLAGLLTGFLPCGLVYAYLVLAASCGSLPGGMQVMALFGLGTAPLMLLTGLGGSVLSLGARQRALRVAAWCVVLTGVVTIGRGAVGLWKGGSAESPCPFCVSGR